VERALLDDPGPLAGRQLSAHPLTFSLAAAGFAAQTSYAAEPADPRFRRQRRNP
jgi:hypothetical protein